jgi:hypothetical protein
LLYRAALVSLLNACLAPLESCFICRDSLISTFVITSIMEK